MPPRRRPPAPGASAAATASKLPATARPSKLAKENNITAQEESEIREAFSLFAEPLQGEKEGVIPIADVRRALIALGIPPATPSDLTRFTAALDPSDEGFATYAAFLSLCAIQFRARRNKSSEEDSEAHRAEVDEAFALFTATTTADTGSGSGEEEEEEEGRVITLGDLRRVAALLRLDGAGAEGKDSGREVVTEEVLRDMILEANGGRGVGVGVGKGEFEGVMRRAGVWRS